MDDRMNENLQATTELTSRFQEIQVVAAAKVLCQTNNTRLKTLFAVMVSRVFGNVARKLRHFDFTLR